MKRTLFLLSAAAMGLVPGFGANYTVTRTNDTGPGSLRAIITEANATLGPHLIEFATTGDFTTNGGTITLTSPLPEISQSVTIKGRLNAGIGISTIPTAGLVAYYPFDGNAADASGNGNDGTVIGAQLAQDRFGNVNSAYLFNGTDNYISVLNSPSLNFGDQITVSAWIFPDYLRPSQAEGGMPIGIVTKAYDGGTMDWHFCINGEQQRPVIGGVYWDSTPVVQAQVWQHVVFTYDGGAMKTYWNSVQSGQQAASGTFRVDAAPLWIGAYYPSYSAVFFPGRLDDICIYNRALSESEIAMFGSIGFDGSGIAIRNSGFTFAQGTSNTLERLRIAGSVSNRGNLRAENCRVIGGISSTNQLTLVECSVIRGSGPGIALSGVAVISRSYVEGHAGNGIENAGQLVLADTRVLRNGGAGIQNSGTVVAERSTVGKNANQGIVNSGQLVISQFTAYYNGGMGILNTGNLVANRSTLNGNAGGISAASGSVSLTLTNCTISGNVGSSMGGLALQGGEATLVNCTIANNTAASSAGGILVGPGRTLTLLNTIVANNAAPQPQSPDVSGSVTSLGHNFIGNSAGSSGWDILTDYLNEDPKLGPFQDNGGPTWTHALLPGSLAILGGTSAGAPMTDQRGVVRPLGKCDVGAFQFTMLMAPTITWPKPADIFYGTPLGPTQLNAVSDVGGTFAYDPSAGTILPAVSNQVLTAVFVPTDPQASARATNTVSINVLKASQTIDFPAIPNQQIGDPPIVLSAPASSGLPVVFSVVSGPALIAGNLLALGSTPGQVVVRASQAGNSNYLAAPSVDRSFFLFSSALPIFTRQPTNLTVNVGADASFSAAATTQPLTYQWQFRDLDLPNETNATLTLRRVRATQAGPYRVIASNPAGSTSSDVAVLTVNVPPGYPVIVNQPQSQAIRIGESAQLSVSATGDPTLSYQWYRGVSGNTNDPVAGATQASYTASGLTATTSYWVNVRNGSGMADSETATVTVVLANAARLSLEKLAGMWAVWIDGQPGTRYRLDYAADPGHGPWTNLIDFNMVNNPFTFVDSGASGATNRFYRAIAP